MNNLMNNIKNAITSSIEELINNISEKYNIDVNELSELWNNNSSNLKISSVKTKTIKKDKSVSSSSVSSTDDNKCPYIFSRGEKQGEICGVKSKKDCEYCSKHQKYEGVGQPVEKKKTPKAKNTIAEKSLPKKKTPVKKSVELEKTFKLNKDAKNMYLNTKKIKILLKNPMSLKKMLMLNQRMKNHNLKHNLKHSLKYKHNLKHSLKYKLNNKKINQFLEQ